MFWWLRIYLLTSSVINMLLYKCLAVFCALVIFVISVAVLQVIGFVFIPFATIDSNLSSLSVSAGVHVCACILCVYNCSALLLCVTYLYIGWYVGVYVVVPCFTVLCCVYLCRALDTFSICFPSVSPSPCVSPRPFQLTL